MYIDVHCHLDKKNYGELSALVKKCGESGVGRIVTVGFDLPSSYLAAEIAERYECVYFTAGFHPTELAAFKEGDLNQIAALCAHEKCIALGEIGLDYHYPDTQKELQREVFLAQLELANRLEMPVQIHSRDCAEDMLFLLSQNKSLLKNGALLHCYSHSPEMAEEFLKLGLCFSFGGASTWKSNKKAKRTLALLPLESILTETDSPYMPPASLYGTFPNTPLSVPEICACIADIKGVTAETVQKTVMENARRLFKKLG